MVRVAALAGTMRLLDPKPDAAGSLMAQHTPRERNIPPSSASPPASRLPSTPCGTTCARASSPLPRRSFTPGAALSPCPPPNPHPLANQCLVPIFAGYPTADLR